MIRTVRGPLHSDEIPIHAELVRRLVNHQFPEFRSHPLVPLAASGSSNALYRLGEHLLVRLPRQPGGTATIDKEHQWLPVVGPHLPVAVPQVVAVGEPAFGYPERWALVRWLDGLVPAAPAEAFLAPFRRELARDLGRVVSCLRSLDVPERAEHDRNLRWYRGERITALDTEVRQAVEFCRGLPNFTVDLGTVVAVWDESMRLPNAEVPVRQQWYHGDLFAENLLFSGHRLTGLLDFGGLGVGDPTVDLIAAWELLDAESRTVFRAAVGVDDETWCRGRAWALALSMLTFPYYWETMPDRCTSRLAIVHAVINDAKFGQVGSRFPQ